MFLTFPFIEQAIALKPPLQGGEVRNGEDRGGATALAPLAPSKMMWGSGRSGPAKNAGRPRRRPELSLLE